MSIFISPSYIVVYLQLREHGQYGDPGIHALQHVEQGQEPVQGTLMVVCLVREMLMRPRAAKVSFGKSYYLGHQYSFLFFISVEGIWGTWDPWGNCSGICDSNATQSRTRNFTGGTIPCNGSDIETVSCQGKELYESLQKSYSYLNQSAFS